MDCINEVAAVAYHEARASEEGMKAVVHVIMNRANQSGVSTCKIVRQPKQFMANGPIKEPKRLELAKQIVTHPGPDITKGATYFHNGTVRPYWIKHMTITFRFGGHIYYKV